MRGFFLLLLLTNIGFYAWQYFALEKPRAIVPYGGVVPRNEGLKLLSELDEGERPPARQLVNGEGQQERGGQNEASPAQVVEEGGETSTVTAEAPTAAEEVSTVRCYRSNMLAELEEAKALQRTLKRMGVKESWRRTVETSVVNYWVKLNPYDNRAKANEAADILRKRRVKDFFIVRSGRHENAISLGVFSTRERAAKRYREITSLKAHLRKPVIEAMELPAKRLIVEFTLQAGDAPDGLDKLLDPSKSPHLQKIACRG